MLFFHRPLAALAAARITSNNVSTPTDIGNAIHGTMPIASKNTALLFGETGV